MTLKIHRALALTGLLLASGCTSSGVFESPPVEVTTDRGIVLCQLYAHDTVWWDEAVAAPNGMAISEADRVCRNEGRRRLADHDRD